MAGGLGPHGAMDGHGATTMHAALADGQWHSFGGARGGGLGGAHATLTAGLNGNGRFGGRE
jgi:LDH2 family malate/lactate/ureidoglycolate dehydrogenase